MTGQRDILSVVVTSMRTLMAIVVGLVLVLVGIALPASAAFTPPTVAASTTNYDWSGRVAQSTIVGDASPWGGLGRKESLAPASSLLHVGASGVAAKYGRDLPIGPASEDAWTVLNRVDANGAPLPGYKGGKTFLNDGSQGPARLPEGPAYREWDLSPNVKGVPRDVRRLVTGGDGSAYYTTDHYLSFIQFR